MQKEMKEIVEKISIPRHVGTENETKVINYLVEKAKSYQLPVKEETFKTSPAFMHGFNTIPYFIFGILICCYTISNAFYYNPITALLFGVLFIIGGFCSENILRSFKRPIIKRFGEQIETRNIIIGEESKNDDLNPKKINIYVVAHTDSKSEGPQPAHVFFLVEYISILLGTFIYGLHVIIFTISFLVTEGIFMHSPTVLIYGLLFGVIDCLRILCKYANDSAGACDDASGVAIVMELMKHFQNSNLENINLIGILSGSEEMGEVGTYNFIKNRKDQLTKEKDHFIIVDGVASKDIIYFTSHGFAFKPLAEFLTSHFQVFLQNNSEFEKKFKISGSWMPPPVNTDHSPVLEYKLPVLAFASTGLVQTHTAQDTPELIDFNTLENFTNLLIDYLKYLDKNCFILLKSNL
jgi:Peptidase family M28